MDKSKESVNKKLKELGFYKYVDTSNLESIIDKIFENYSEEGVINFPWEGLNRVFGIDAESIYESGGIYDQIEGMLSMFKKMGIDLIIDDYIEDFDNNSETYIKRLIKINGKIYDTSGASDWGAAFNSGLNLVDEILKDFGKEERVFGLFMDESSVMIILEEANFEYLLKLIPENSPYRPIDIKKMMEE